MQVALGREDRDTEISVAAAASSIRTHTGPVAQVPMRDAAALIRSHCPHEIGCLKLNIEGAEYDVLDRLCDAGMLPGIRSLLLQFHRFTPDDERRRASIQARLAEAHRLIFDYPFVWERWELRSCPTHG
jgi:hypothetical protein